MGMHLTANDARRRGRPSFKVAKEMLHLLGYFGSSVDAVGEVIQRINARLDILERRVTDLEAQVRALNYDLRQTQNLSRVLRLKDKQSQLELPLFNLRQKPTERRAKLSPVGALNTSFTLLARGEFSIIIADLALAGGLAAIIQPFATLYVRILASAAPLLAKESERIYGLFEKLFDRLGETKKADDESGVTDGA